MRVSQLTADAEALCSLVGMKKTGSKASRPSFACNITGTDMKTKFNLDGLVMWTKESHEADCRRIGNTH